MSRVLLILGLAGAALLLAATIILVKLNWSEKVFAPLFSIFLGGIVTTLIATLSMLRPSVIETAFLTSVVLDSATNRPIWVTPYPDNTALTRRLSTLMTLGSPARARNGTTEITVEASTTVDQQFSYCGELIQYQMLRTLQDIQRGGTTIAQANGTSTSTLQDTPKIPRLTKYPGEAFIPEVTQNRFSNSDLESSNWEYSNFPLPTGTKVLLRHIPSSPASGPEEYWISLLKPSFFRIDVRIQPEISPGLPQRALNLTDELRARAKTFNFKVRLRAGFDRLSAGNWQTDDLKKWAEWLFAQLRSRQADE